MVYGHTLENDKQSGENIAEHLPASLRLLISVMEILAHAQEQVDGGVERIDTQLVWGTGHLRTQVDVVPAVEVEEESQQPGEHDDFELQGRREDAFDLVDDETNDLQGLFLNSALGVVPCCFTGLCDGRLYEAGGQGQCDVDVGYGLGGSDWSGDTGL